jgi:hypothetical protein
MNMYGEVEVKLYTHGKGPWYPLDRRPGEPQSQSGCYEEDENLAPARNQTSAVQPIASCYTDWAFLALRKKIVLTQKELSVLNLFKLVELYSWNKSFKICT